MRERNHEGYNDPTACRAIKRADRQRRRKTSRKAAASVLSYTLGELLCFQQILVYFRS